ncbi:hypothetical protein DBR42_07220 [Pelomonas sp. HMWF004]|nr:hypothetical protein DBR42_07220 [Pelomonas sp. HMWF004]
MGTSQCKAGRAVAGCGRRSHAGSAGSASAQAAIRPPAKPASSPMPARRSRRNARRSLMRGGPGGSVVGGGWSVARLLSPSVLRVSLVSPRLE